MNNYYNDIKEYIDANLIDTIALYINDSTYIEEIKKDVYNNISTIYNNLNTIHNQNIKQ